MINIGIVGGTGYTGVELLRLLAQHPQARITCITSRTEQGKTVGEFFPSLLGSLNLTFTEPDVDQLGACDVVFFATPNGVAMTMARALLERGTRIIDLAADFRLKDINTWQSWYGMEHQCPDLVEQAVYGFSEQNRLQVADARLVGNPGCYPTCIGLGILPLMENQAAVGGIIADAKSGVSGAGRKAAHAYLLTEAGENINAYSVGGHRHIPEIAQILQQAGGQAVPVTFVPHLTPMSRGMLATVYTRSDLAEDSIRALYRDRYADEPFVQLLPAGQVPHTKAVRGSNTCQVALHKQGDQLIITSVIDNLTKGAAGQAVQNLNIMFGLREEEGLHKVGLVP